MSSGLEGYRVVGLTLFAGLGNNQAFAKSTRPRSDNRQAVIDTLQIHNRIPNQTKVGLVGLVELAALHWASKEQTPRS